MFKFAKAQSIKVQKTELWKLHCTHDNITSIKQECTQYALPNFKGYLCFGGERHTNLVNTELYTWTALKKVKGYTHPKNTFRPMKSYLEIEVIPASLS